MPCVWAQLFSGCLQKGQIYWQGASETVVHRGSKLHAQHHFTESLIASSEDIFSLFFLSCESAYPKTEVGALSWPYDHNTRNSQER